MKAPPGVRIVLICLAVMPLLIACSKRAGREPIASSPSLSPTASPTPSQSPSPSSLPSATASPSASPTTAPAAQPAQAPQAPAGKPAPPVPVTNLRDFRTWEGPDEAVATWYSQRCGREVLRFGAQQYTLGSAGVSNPPDVADLGYSLGNQRLYGNRGAPDTLYVTTDGRTFQEWLAVGETC